MEERVHWWREGQVIGGEGTLVVRRASNWKRGYIGGEKGKLLEERVHWWGEGQVIGGEGTLVGRRTSNWRRGYIGGEKDK